MRSSLMLLGMIAGGALAIAHAQTAAAPSGAVPQAGSRSGPQAVATAANEPKTAHPARSSRERHAHAPPAGTPGRASAAKGDGVLALGATDITGNKELPKVMVIVPWKDATGAGGVIKPTDSLMNEVLEPVDRGVFQRRIRYYGQLESSRAAGTARQTVAPDGDNR
ncbi:MAG TPA: hypothetical protein VMD06_11465 [Steroidobacteraceae bacterium]|nr:hypothetical protein [Steroidobacteraceae bacterium]